MPGQRKQRAIGIQIIAGADGRPSRLVGVLTDRLARKVDTPTEEDLPLTAQDRVVDAIEQLVMRLGRDLDQDDQLVGVGIEVPGLLNGGLVVNAPALHWRNFPLLNRLTPKLGPNVVLVNDANALAVYERDFPADDAVSDPNHFVVVLINETGIGLGLLLNGAVYEGSKGMAGELGHITIDDDANGVEQCQCGKVGCLQAMATAGAIRTALAGKGIDLDDDATKSLMNHPEVAEIYTRAGAALGKGLSTVVNIINPSTIVIYGQPSLIGEARKFHIDGHHASDGVAGQYMNAAIENMRRHVFEKAADDCFIIVRKMEDYRGAEAAAACAIDHVAMLDRH